MTRPCSPTQTGTRSAGTGRCRIADAAEVCAGASIAAVIAVAETHSRAFSKTDDVLAARGHGAARFPAGATVTPAAACATAGTAAIGATAAAVSTGAIVATGAAGTGGRELHRHAARIEGYAPDARVGIRRHHVERQAPARAFEGARAGRTLGRGHSAGRGLDAG